MNATEFDRLTSGLGHDHSRRAVVSLIASGAVTLLAGINNHAEAGCKKVGKKCDKNKDCCNGATCKGKKCKCKSGYQDCDDNGKCERSTNDDANCGSCGNICSDGESCQDGTCQICVANTPVFESPTEICNSDAECCGNGLCCTFPEPGGAQTGCYDLRSHTTACGLSCDAVVNCLNTDQVCVDGECVDP